MFDKNDKELLTSLIVGIFIGCIFGSIVSYNVSQKEVYNRAIEANVAEYVCDSKIGITTFQWIKPNKDEK